MLVGIIGLAEALTGGWLLMHKNQILRSNRLIFRVLEMNKDKTFVVNCVQPRVPYWIDSKQLENFEEISQEELLKVNNINMPLFECLSLKERAVALNKYASISPILPVIRDETDRNDMIAYLAEKQGLNRRTLIRRLYLYLAFQDICIYAINERRPVKELSKDEQNYRYILNKYFYTRQKRTLRSCYLMLLREKYSTPEGIKEDHPSFYQFKYYYYKTRKLDSFYISREGRSEYDRNIRPLLSHSRDYFNCVGYGLADSTTLDIYLLDKQGKPKRPYMAAMVDAYSNMCLGFSIGFEGGESLLKKLIFNVNSNKVDYCKTLGIDIDECDYPSKGIPIVIVSDNGKDYTSSYFTQLTDLGIQIQTNKTHSPQMKSAVERFFGLIQELIKPSLMNYGVVGKDNYPEKPKENAVLTLEDLERILCRAIIYFNSKRINNLPNGKEYLKPYANELFLDSFKEYPNTFINVSNEIIRLTMLPRTRAKFTRFGLNVGRLNYRAYGFVNDYLESKKDEVVAYDPNDVGKVWLLRDKYYEFTLIDSYFDGKTLKEVDEIRDIHKLNQKAYLDESIDSEIQLGKDIEKIINERGAK